MECRRRWTFQMIRAAWGTLSAMKEERTSRSLDTWDWDSRDRSGLEKLDLRASAHEWSLEPRQQEYLTLFKKRASSRKTELLFLVSISSLWSASFSEPDALPAISVLSQFSSWSGPFDDRFFSSELPRDYPHLPEKRPRHGNGFQGPQDLGPIVFLTSNPRVHCEPPWGAFSCPQTPQAGSLPLGLCQTCFARYPHVSFSTFF